MKAKKKDENGEEYEVVVVATDKEVQKFKDLDARKKALDDTASALMQGVADEFEKLEREKGKCWDRFVEKYNLSNENEHSLDFRTREIMERPKLWSRTGHF